MVCWNPTSLFHFLALAGWTRLHSYQEAVKVRTQGLGQGLDQGLGPGRALSLGGILERELDEKCGETDTKMERKWNVNGTELEPKWNVNTNNGT